MILSYKSNEQDQDKGRILREQMNVAKHPDVIKEAGANLALSALELRKSYL